MSLKTIRRIVTANDPQGRSAVRWEGPAPGQHENAQFAGRGHTDFWVWRQTPQPLQGDVDTGLWADEFPGPREGGHLRVVHWLPGNEIPVVKPHAPKPSADGRSWDRGGGNNCSISDMHKTESVDFGIVLHGERGLVLDDYETVIRPGDIVVQVGAWHLWDSSRIGCHMAFDMISADFGPGRQGVQQGDAQPLQPPAGMQLPAGVRPQRRIVTIDREPGRSALVIDGASPDVRLDASRPGFALQRMWVVEGHPAPIVPETLRLPHVLVPPANGTVLNVMTIPPDANWHGRASEAAARAWFESIGAGSVATCGSIPGNPYSKQSSTVDFLVVTEGELTLLLDTGETRLAAGEIAVVRGGNYALGNASDRPAVVAVASHDAVQE
jgi:uncharacterized cupin superfamily protein